LSSSPCLGDRGPRHGTEIPVGNACPAAGTRPELDGNRSGTGVAANEASQAVPRLDRDGVPLAVRFRIASITYTKGAEEPPKRFALRGGIRGALGECRSGGCQIRESQTARERRAWVERQERFKDLQEEYERRSAAASTPEERRQLAQAFSEQRRAHREEDVRLGKRSPGLAVQMHQIMWARWIEVAVEHERGQASVPGHCGEARERRDPPRVPCVTRRGHRSSPHHRGGVRGHQVPHPPANASGQAPCRDKRHQELRHGFRVAFGVSGATDNRLAEELKWLFTLRDSAAHPYTESEPPAKHPAGINTGVEHSNFNAITSGRAVDAAMAVMDLVASPPKPSGRWIERWASDRAPYQVGIQQLRRDRDSRPLRVP
jgi:hypothetical protein